MAGIYFVKEGIADYFWYRTENEKSYKYFQASLSFLNIFTFSAYLGNLNIPQNTRLFVPAAAVGGGGQIRKKHS